MMQQPILYTFLLIYAISFGSCTSTHHIVGNWKVYSKGDFYNEEYNFQKNGTLEIKRPNKDLEINNWEYSPKNKCITVSTLNNPEETLFFITYVDGFFLNLSDNNDALYFARQLKIKSLSYSRFRKKIKGEWSLMQLDNDSLKSNESMSKFIFWDNGIYQEISSDEARLGRWFLSDDQTEITFSNEDYTQTIGVSFTKKNKLQFTDEYGSFLLEKTDQIKKSPTNKKIAKSIVGAWLLNKVDEEVVAGAEYTLYLNEDGSLKIFESQHITQVGQWYVSEDGTFLVLEYSDEQEHYPIKTIGAQKLVLLDDFQNVTFRRIVE